MTPVVTFLVLANVVLFMASTAAPIVFELFALVPAAVLQRPWTVVTYMFLHGGFMHLLFNMLGLFFFGPRMEARLGTTRFTTLYFLSGIGGAVLSFLFASSSAVVGASGAVLGVLAGYARFWPEDRIYIWGIIPVSARVMVIGLVVISIYSGLTGARGSIAHFAHLGGLAAGWAFVAWSERRRRSQWPPQNRTSIASAINDVRERGERMERWEAIRLDELHEINRAETERILTKLRSQGLSSLTAEEREYLDRMSTR